MSRVWCFYPAAFMSQNACIPWVYNIKLAHFFYCTVICERQHDSQYAFVVPALEATSALLQFFFFWQAVIVLWRPLETRSLKSFSVVLHKIKTFLVSVWENVFFLFMIKTFKRHQCTFSWVWNILCYDIWSIKKLPLYHIRYANSSCVFGTQLCNPLYLISCILYSLA